MEFVPIRPPAAPLAYSEDDRTIIDAGYKPQLHRRLHFFSSFALSFSFMSVLVGVFANYGFMLNKAGTFGLWTWLLVGVGQFLVALVFAEMAGRMPLTGALYNWNTRLHNPTLGWFAAWMLAFAYVIGAAGVIVALIPLLQSFLGHALTLNAIRVLGAVIIIVQLLINIFGVRLAANINRVAVIIEIITIVGVSILLIALVFIKHDAHVEFLTVIPSTPRPYLPAFLVSSLIAAWTLFGFETPADVSEETIQVKRITPVSIVSSVAASIILGFFFLVVLTIAIPNVATITAASDPISAIVQYHLGAVLTKVFLLLVVVALFASSLVGIMTGARLLFAVARDKRLPGHMYFAKVSERGIPLYAVMFVAAVDVFAYLLFYGLSVLYAVPVILVFLIYLGTIVSYAVGIRKFPPESSFSLGVLRWPIMILASMWLCIEIGVLTLPQDFHLSAEVAGIVMAIGAVFYLLVRYTSPAEWNG
jgi:amino acid transporter